ncbi:beta-lactamase family protein [Thalassobius sp. Cn5-15]|nr:beta-lactamase family protein [Thalassobius sp. Cn5-15]
MISDVGCASADVAPQDLMFEIGSITKVFTAILLCLMEQEGKVDPDAPLHHLSKDLTEAQQARFVSPRLPKGTAVLPWRFQALAGAGCLRSSAADMARFAGHVLAALDGGRIRWGGPCNVLSSRFWA